MKIHLARTQNFKEEDFDEVVAVIRGFNGPLQFHPIEVPYTFEAGIIKAVHVEKKDFEAASPPIKSRSNFALKSKKIAFPLQSEVLSWKNIFEACRQIRVLNEIPSDEGILLLTDYTNEVNWFTGGEASDQFNVFVQTSYWNYFLSSDQKYPIAYHIAVAPLKRLMFDNYEELTDHLHQQTIGCMMDFCEDKKDITLKLRTGDICKDCQAIIRKKEIDTQLVRQVFTILDSIRGQMLFKERFLSTSIPSRMIISGRSHIISFPEMGKLKLPLTPLEKAVYLVFLKSDGIAYHNIMDYRDGLYHYYKHLSIDDNIAIVNNRIDALVDLRDNSSLREKISPINRKLKRLLGDELAKLYVISGERGEAKKILLDRTYVRDYD